MLQISRFLAHLTFHVDIGFFPYVANFYPAIRCLNASVFSSSTGDAAAGAVHSGTALVGSLPLPPPPPQRQRPVPQAQLLLASFCSRAELS